MSIDIPIHTSYTSLIFMIHYNINNQMTTGNHPTLPQCGRDGVVLYGLHSRDVKLNDYDEDDTIHVVVVSESRN